MDCLPPPPRLLLPPPPLQQRCLLAAAPGRPPLPCQASHPLRPPLQRALNLRRAWLRAPQLVYRAVLRRTCSSPLALATTTTMASRRASRQSQASSVHPLGQPSLRVGCCPPSRARGRTSSSRQCFSWVTTRTMRCSMTDLEGRSKEIRLKDGRPSKAAATQRALQEAKCQAAQATTTAP